METEAELVEFLRKRFHADLLAAAEDDEAMAMYAAEVCSNIAMRDCSTVDLTVARAVLERTHEQWAKYMSEFKAKWPQGSQGRPTSAQGGSVQGSELELEWATMGAALRMLRANIGDAKDAVEMFVKALKLRAKDRTLLRTMRCEPRSDLRIIGRDLEGRPTIYFCCRSHTEPLRAIRDQCIVTLEAACKLTSEDGKLVLLIDMHCLQPHLWMDLGAITDLADMFGIVFAERVFRIMIIDFSRAATAIWWTIKPMMRQTTRDKFQFVSREKAEASCRRDFDDETFEKIRGSFTINRDPGSSAEDRDQHARRTSVCDVPFGPPLK
jgi:hypothetical protein